MAKFIIGVLFLLALISCKENSAKLETPPILPAEFQDANIMSKATPLKIDVLYDGLSNLSELDDARIAENNAPLSLFVPPGATWCDVHPVYCVPPWLLDPPRLSDDDDDNYKYEFFDYLLDYDYSFRNFDGSDNHPQDLGSAAPESGTNNATSDSALVRLLDHSYEMDGSTPDVTNLPHPRVVSNEIFDQQNPIPNQHQLSHFLYFWGQFLDHDIVLTPASGDTSFSIPPGVDDLTMNGVTFFRSDSLVGGNPRAQYNANTSFIDASQVYGSSDNRADWLRRGLDGLLKTSAGDFLPYGSASGDSPFMAGLQENPALADPSDLFVAGDVRANEVLSLIALHTLFVREHNRIAQYIKIKSGLQSDETIFQLARKVVGALMQAITYNEFLPALGISIPDVAYDSSADPRITNMFATGGFRLGHTMISDQVELIDNEGSQSSIDLFSSFFNPQLVNESLLADLFRGGAHSLAELIDNKVVSGLRNFLFGPPGSGLGLDLAMFNIHRGRDHGLGSYLTLRDFFDGENKLTLPTQTVLLNIYPDLASVDLWVGALSEPHLVNKPLGQSLEDMLVDQFTKLKQGDRYYYNYDKDFKPEGVLAELGLDLNYINNRKLSRIITDNTQVQSSEVPTNIFIVP